MSDALVPAKPGEFLFYQTDDGQTRIQVRLEGETVWLTQKQMADLFQKDVRTISEHIRNIYEEAELQETATLRKFRTVQTEGSRQPVDRHLEQTLGELEKIEGESKALPDPKPNEPKKKLGRMKKPKEKRE